MRLRRSRLSHRQSERLLEHFVAGTPARPAAELVGVNRNTARYFYQRLRKLIAQRLAQSSPLKGAADLSGPGFGSTHNVPVFGLLKRGDKVYTVMPPDSRNETSMPALKARVRPDSIVYSDTFDVDGVLHVFSLRHRRVRNRARLARGRAPIDSIENFWNQAKRHLRRYNGIPQRHFHWFLKECEWRFNYGSPKQLLKLLKSWIRTRSRRTGSMPARSVHR